MMKLLIDISEEKDGLACPNCGSGVVVLLISFGDATCSNDMSSDKLTKRDHGMNPESSSTLNLDKSR